jgi:hypothetical protein
LHHVLSTAPAPCRSPSQATIKEEQLAKAKAMAGVTPDVPHAKTGKEAVAAARWVD